MTQQNNTALILLALILSVQNLVFGCEQFGRSVDLQSRDLLIEQRYVIIILLAIYFAHSIVQPSSPTLTSPKRVG